MRLARLIAPAALILVAASSLGAQGASRETALRLLTAQKSRETMESSMEAMLNAQMKAAPQMAQFANVFREFFKEELSWAKMEPDMIAVYSATYTEQEARDLIAFFESPTGKMMTAKQPALTVKAAEVSQGKMQEAMPRLMQKIQAAMAGGAARDTVRTPR